MAEPLNLQQLSDELLKAGTPWQMDPNTSMAQLTEDERIFRLGFTPPPDEMSFEEAVKLDKDDVIISAAEIQAESASLPAAVDLRNFNGRSYVTAVKNQGGCGSCVAFGTAAVLETTYRKLNNATNINLDLSEAHLFYCHGKAEGRNCGNGWFPQRALENCKTKGITFEQYFPYTAGDQNCSLRSGWQDYLAKVSGYTKVNGRANIKNWLATKGSLAGCMIVYQDFFSYRSGVYRHISGNQSGGHCIEIIGYNDAQGCWICKNSWGTNWGENGFFRIAYGQCQLETWAGPYGANSINLKMWHKNTQVSGFWVNSADRNAWVYLKSIGWRRVARNNATIQHTMLLQLCAARAAKRRINVLEENKTIVQIYVL